MFARGARQLQVAAGRFSCAAAAATAAAAAAPLGQSVAAQEDGSGALMFWQGFYNRISVLQAGVRKTRRWIDLMNKTRIAVCNTLVSSLH